MISLTVWKILYLFADDFTLYHGIPHPSNGYTAASFLSSDIHNIRNWSNTWNRSFNPEKSHTLILSLQKEHTANPSIYFLNNLLLCHSNSWVSLSAMNSPLQRTFQSWTPAWDANWAYSSVYGPSMAYLSFYPPTRLSSTA